jgi:hypothetical protein
MGSRLAWRACMCFVLNFLFLETKCHRFYNKFMYLLILTVQFRFVSFPLQTAISAMRNPERVFLYALIYLVFCMHACMQLGNYCICIIYIIGTIYVKDFGLSRVLEFYSQTLDTSRICRNFARYKTILFCWKRWNFLFSIFMYIIMKYMQYI